ncbi:MAG TPA: VOC family protein [Bryobacteraceae bacterium]|nr:VOC family protein [Bryobacteraceae bacterium]
MPERALDEQLDQIIDGLLAGARPAADPELAALAEIADGLRHLPDESFQKRLRADLQRRASMPASTAAPVREGLRTVTPFIAVPKAAELIEFLKRTLDAEETSRHPHGDGFVSALRVGDSDVLIMDFKSGEAPSRVGAFHVFVPDCDATYHRAIQAGGTSLGEPADRPYGERSGFVKDSVGNYWYIATRFASNVAPQGAGSVVPYLHPAKARPFIDFLKRAFGAEELAVYEHDGRVMHAVARIGDAVLEMGESPDFLASSFYMNVADCDAAYQRAIEAGATSLWPPTDQVYGERTAGLVDPFGYQWMPATRIQGAR